MFGFIENAYRHMKIKHKLSLLITFIVAVSLAFTLAVQQYAFWVYDEQIFEKSSQLLNASSSSIEKELKRIERLSYTIVSDAQIQSWLTTLEGNPSEYDRLRISQLLIDRLFSYTGSEPNLYSVQLFDAAGAEYVGGNSMAIEPSKKERMFRISAEAQGEARWVYPDRQDGALIAIREIRSFQNSIFDLHRLGTLVVRINIGRIVEDMGTEQGNLSIVSGDGVIYPREPSVDIVPTVRENDAESGYSIRSLNGEPYFIAHIRSPMTGWMYVNVTPFNQIFKHIVFIKQLAVFVFIAILFTVILLGIRFSRGITRPIDDLVGRMKLAEKGNFEEANLFYQTPTSMDEIGRLQRTFRLMVERINMLIKENYENRLLIKETEFKALQAQINPHFLYNTLESINWMAKVNRQSHIAEMVESLAFLLRYSIDMKEPLIRIGEEIDIVRSYITIQSYRFEDRLEFMLNVPDRILEYPIPKLTLQPLVENAIHYALEPSVEPCRIEVTGKETDEFIILTVADSGPGMPADTLDKLRKGEVKARGRGIGLLNIDERMKLTFGDAYGLRIVEEPGGGAVVMLLFPRQIGGMNHV